MSILERSNFDNKHKGERGYVIGSGPSISTLIDSGFDFRLLDNEVTLAINQSIKLGELTYATSIDPGFLGRNSGYLNSHRSSTVYLLPSWVTEVPVVKDKILRLQVQRESKVEIPTDLASPLPSNSNSGAFGVMLAYLLGCDPIYLLGFDGKKVEGKIHFHDDYKHWYLSDQQVESMSTKCEKVIRVLVQRGITIYSCSSLSRLNSLLEYRDIREVLDGSTT